MSERKLFKRPFKVGNILGIEILARPSAILAALLIWLIFSLLGIKAFKWKPATAVSSGFLAMVIHFISEGWHQIGHSQMAEQTGYPMEGMEFWGPLATSKYPENEGMLAADVHIQRALGGPIFSFTLALISCVITLALRPIGGPALILAFFTFLDNLLVFTVGALFPLGFNDGSTLLHWWPQRPHGRRFLSLDR
jgi:Zn-dependent protease